MPTIYLDTCFYVWLARADEAIARHAVRALNELRVRPVLSLQLLGELTSDPFTVRRNPALFSRLQGLERAPYKTRASLTWASLLIDPELAARHGEAHRLSALGDAIGLTAVGTSKRAYRRRLADLPEAVREKIREDYETPAGMAQRIRESCAQLAPLLPLLSSIGIQQHGDLEARLMQAAERVADCTTMKEAQPIMEQVSQDMRNLSATIVDKLGMAKQQGAVSAIRNVLLRRNQTASAWGAAELKGEDPAISALLASDHASDPKEEAVESLIGALGDTEHMGTFIAHSNHIDFLQLDGPQFRQLAGRGQSHPVVQAGLAGRCFAAPNLEGALRTIAALCSNGAS